MGKSDGLAQYPDFERLPAAHHRGKFWIPLVCDLACVVNTAFGATTNLADEENRRWRKAKLAGSDLGSGSTIYGDGLYDGFRLLDKLITVSYARIS